MSVRNLNLYAPLTGLLSADVPAPFSVLLAVRNSTRSASGAPNPAGSIFRFGTTNFAAAADLREALLVGWSNNAFYTDARKPDYSGAQAQYYPDFPAGWRFQASVLTSTAVGTLFANGTNAPLASVDYPILPARKLTLGITYIGDADYLATRYAHVHIIGAAVTQVQLDAVQAGTLNPVNIAGHIDGWALLDDLTSVKGGQTLTASGTGTDAPIFEATDNPIVAAAGGTVTPPAPVRRHVISGII